MSYVPLEWDDDIMSGLSTPAVVSSLEKQWMAEEQLRAIGELIGSADAGTIFILNSICLSIFSIPSVLKSQT